MENKESMSPILIVILSVLGTCLVGFLVWYGIKYFDQNESGETTSSSEIESTTNPVHEKVEINNNISKDMIDLYNELRSDVGGFYFKDSVSIDNISVEALLKYALGMYVLENDLDLSNAPLDCEGETRDDHWADCEGVELPFASKETIDNYIKKKFNTTRKFDLTKYVYDGVEYPTVGGQLSALNTSDLGDYEYKFSNKTYYFGHGARGSEETNIYTKLLNVKEDRNNVYFYDKAVFLTYGAGGNYLFNSATYELNNELFEFNDIDEGKKYKEVKLDINDNIILNEDYVFNKYANKLNTYKHTYKKVNGNYYWVSSEIVK